mgnify:CR=1 FL=1
MATAGIIGMMFCSCRKSLPETGTVPEEKPDTTETVPPVIPGQINDPLGFIEEERKAPVMFAVDPDTWKRTPVRTEVNEGKLFFRNFGSRKFRLKITDYK